jgi:hypothetical protein
VEIGADCFRDSLDFLGRSFPVGSKLLHLWGSLTATGDQPAILDAVPGSQFFRACPPTFGGVWQITTTAIEYRRDAGEGTLLPLADIAISQVPAGLAFTRRTVMQLQVFANDGVDTRMFFMDANQSITIVAQEVCVRWMAPPGTQDIEGRTVPADRNLPRAGLVIDAFVGTSLSRIEQPPGDNSSVIFTTHLAVPATVRGVVEIPPYAQEVTVYQAATTGTASVSWEQHYGNPNTGSVEVGALPFMPGLRRTQPESGMFNASHLRTDIDPDNARFFSLRWVVRP